MRMMAFRLAAKSTAGIVALAGHCSKCSAIADDGETEVDAASVLAMFTLNYKNTVTVTLFGGDELDRIMADINDDPRLHSIIIREEVKED